MNPAHLHLLTTHIPVVGTFFGLFLLLFGCLRKSDELKRASLLVFLVAAIITLPAYLSGSPTAALLKRLVIGVSMDAGDQHAEVAILGLSGSLVLGVVSLLGLIAFRKSARLPGAFVMLTLFLAVVSCALLAWTANLGAQIRHPEIHQTERAAMSELTYRYGPV
jgi:uncharacterized membrane protein